MALLLALVAACLPPAPAPACPCEDAWTRAYVLDVELCKATTTTAAALAACVAGVERAYAGRFGR